MNEGLDTPSPPLVAAFVGERDPRVTEWKFDRYVTCSVVKKSDLNDTLSTICLEECETNQGHEGGGTGHRPCCSFCFLRTV